MLKEIITEEIVRFKVDTNDSYYEALLFSNNLLNESVGWRDITSLIQKIVNKRKTLQTALKKFAASTSRGMKKALLMVILTLLTFESGINAVPVVNDATIEQYAQKSEIDQQDLTELMNLVSRKLNEVMAHQIENLTVSEEGKQFIKKHEGLRLSPYMLGDGMITIGYGHAEPVATSWFRNRMNHKITYAQAEKLFEDDLQKIEAGLKNVLHKLRKEGIVFDITQNMYDAMVSMAFNMGPYGLETSKFIIALRDTKDLVKAAELIKVSRIGNFKGLPKRRTAEYELFTRDLQIPT